MNRRLVYRARVTTRGPVGLFRRRRMLTSTVRAQPRRRPDLTGASAAPCCGHRHDRPMLVLLEVQSSAGGAPRRPREVRGVQNIVATADHPIAMATAGRIRRAGRERARAGAGRFLGGVVRPCRRSRPASSSNSRGIARQRDREARHRGAAAVAGRFAIRGIPTMILFRGGARRTGSAARCRRARSHSGSAI